MAKRTETKASENTDPAHQLDSSIDCAELESLIIPDAESLRECVMQELGGKVAVSDGDIVTKTAAEFDALESLKTEGYQASSSSASEVGVYDQIARSIANSLFDSDSKMIGAFVNLITSGAKDEFWNLDSKEVSDFRQRVKEVEGTPLERVRGIYELVSKSIRYSSVLPSNLGSLEKTLRNGEGICREQAALLSLGLQESGFQAEVKLGSEHAWVRLSTTNAEGQVVAIDLDPTWYEDFVPLDPRPSY